MKTQNPLESESCIHMRYAYSDRGDTSEILDTAESDVSWLLSMLPYMVDEKHSTRLKYNQPVRRVIDYTVFFLVECFSFIGLAFESALFLSRRYLLLLI